MAVERLANQSGQPRPAPALVDVRCKRCRRLLLRAEPNSGRIEVVCPDNRCKRYQQHYLHGA